MQKKKKFKGREKEMEDKPAKLRKSQAYQYIAMGDYCLLLIIKIPQKAKKSQEIGQIVDTEGVGG